MNEDFQKEIIKKISENKLSHAYLIETNNLEATYKKIVELCKSIECEKKYLPNCIECNICNLINLCNHPNVLTLEPDGLTIKKSQILTLIETFLTKPIYSKYNIYIIKEAEKLNESSSNAILKFLEEPEENIIGFFITEERDKLLPTILSRCQIYNDRSEKKPKCSDEMQQLALQYYELLEQNNKNLILSNRNSAMLIANKDNAAVFFNELLKKYLVKSIDSITLQNHKKIIIIKKILENLSYNVNIELCLDSFVIEMSEIDD